MSYARHIEDQRRLKKLYHDTHRYCGAGSYFDKEKGIYRRCLIRSDTVYWKKYSNRRVRHTVEVGKGSSYKKAFDYWWTID